MFYLLAVLSMEGRKSVNVKETGGEVLEANGKEKGEGKDCEGVKEDRVGRSGGGGEKEDVEREREREKKGFARGME